MTDISQPNRAHLEIAAVVLFVLPFVNGFYNPALADNPVLFWTLDIFHYLVVPSGVAVFLFSQSGLRANHIGLHWPKSTAEWIRLGLHTIGFTLVFYVIADNLIQFFSNSYPSRPLFSYEWMTPTSFAGRLLITFYFGITAGLIEEFYYRGVLVKLFNQYGLGKLLTVLVVSCIFSLVHWEGGVKAVLAAFFISAVITAYYTRFGLLFPVIAAHFVYDWVFFFQQR